MKGTGNREQGTVSNASSILCAQRVAQPIKHPADFSRAAQQSREIGLCQIGEPKCNYEVGLDFCQGAMRNLQETDNVLAMRPTVTLSDIGWNGRNRASRLAC